jgi:hypothetical protein
MLQYDLERRTGYLYVTVRGQLTVDDATATFREVMQAAVARKQSKLLLDCSALGAEWAASSRYAFGEFVADEQRRAVGQLGELPRVAIYAVAPLYDPNRFTQVVTNNRGGRMRTSDSLQELLSWLET